MRARVCSGGSYPLRRGYDVVSPSTSFEVFAVRFVFSREGVAWFGRVVLGGCGFVGFVRVAGIFRW